MEEQEVRQKRVPVIIMIGMAGSGKTTLMQRLCSHLHARDKQMYIINIDPAATYVPFPCNIDIRDTVNYKEVMKQFGLGPNGGIMTSLNLFATRFDQVISLIEKRIPTLDYILIDTPGQIEVFNWSASGSIITEALAATTPTIIIYVVDTPRSVSPGTFISNMLYACSTLYKSRLPLVLALNKSDVCRADTLILWLKDHEAFQHAVENADTSFLGLTRSLSLMLEEFYNNFKAVGVSAATGEGIEDFFKAVDQAAEEYEQEYKPLIEERKRKYKEQEEQRVQQQMERLRLDKNQK